MGGKEIVKHSPSTSIFGGRFFYGWIIVGILFMMAGLLMGIRLSFGVFFNSLEENFGLSSASTSSMFSVYWIFCGIFALFGGWLIDRFKPRLIMLGMGLATGLSLILVSQARTFWQVYLSYAVLLALGTGPNQPFLVTAISRWFRNRSKFSMAFGVVTAGGAAGTVVMAPFSAYLIINYGWRHSYLIIGVIALIGMLVLFAMFRNSPGKIGLQLDDSQKSQKREVSALPSSMLKEPTLKAVFCRSDFWFIALSFGAFGISLQLMLAHAVPFAIDKGISFAAASLILSIMSGANSLTRLVGGKSLSNGTKLKGMIAASLLAVALGSMIWASNTGTIYGIAAVVGVAWGVQTLAISILIREHFEGKHLGTITGAANVAFSIGSAIGPFVGGLLYDTFKNYLFAFVFAAGISVTSAILMMMVKNKHLSNT